MIPVVVIGVVGLDHLQGGGGFEVDVGDLGDGAEVLLVEAIPAGEGADVFGGGLGAFVLEEGGCGDGESWCREQEQAQVGGEEIVHVEVPPNFEFARGRSGRF